MAANRGVISAAERSSSRFGRSRASLLGATIPIQQTDMVADCGPEDVIRWPSSSSPLPGTSSECCANNSEEYGESRVREEMHRLQRRREAAPRLFISDKVITGRKRAAQRRSSLCDCFKAAAAATRFLHSSWLVTVLLCTYLMLSSHCGVVEASRQDGE